MVGGRGRAADAVEGLTPDVLVLGTGREAAERPFVKVVPEADRAIGETPVVRHTPPEGSRSAPEAHCVRDQTACVDEGRIPVPECRAAGIEKLRIGLLDTAIGIDVQALPGMPYQSRHCL